MTDNDISFRNEFLIPESLCYLNNGASGACFKEIFERKNYFELELEKKGSRFMDSDYPMLFEKARKSLANHFGGKEENLALVPNVTFGINQVIRSVITALKEDKSKFSFLNKKNAGFVTTNLRYRAYERLWRELETHLSKQIVDITFPKNSSQEIFEEFTQQINPEETSLIYLSHISSPTSLILPIKEISAWARENDILCIIDGAHAPGMIDLNLEEINTDIYLGDCHKWMSSAKGCGFMYIKEELKELLKPLIISYGKTFPGGSGQDFIDDNLWCGINNYSAYLVLPDLFALYEKVGWKNKRKESRELAKKCYQKLTELFPKLPLLYPTDSNLYGQMFSFQLPVKDIEPLKNCLYEKYNIVTGGTNFNKSSLIRPSFAVYNEEKDAECLLNSLAKEMLSFD